jgi:hypothetical protein
VICFKQQGKASRIKRRALTLLHEKIQVMVAAFQPMG